MLAAFRKATNSWFVRGLLLVIASTFALYFGSNGSIFSGLSNQPVATVGSIKISQTAFADAYVRSFANLGGQLTPEQARAFGLPINTLSSLVGAALVENEAKALGLAVSDAMLADQIRAMVGNVSVDQYRLMVNQQGMTVAWFEDQVRRDMLRGQITETIGARLPAPSILAETLLRYRQEQRIVEYVRVADAAAGEIADPDEAAMAAYYAANLGRYNAPELRDLTFLAMLPEGVVDTVQVTDADVRAEYQARIKEFTTPDVRVLQQLFFADEASAKIARDRVTQGVAFEYAANPAVPVGAPPAPAPAPTVAGATPAATPEAAPLPAKTGFTDLGPITRDQLPSEAAAVVFALAQDEVSPPLKTAFGWFLYKPAKVQQGGIRPFEEVQAKLKADLLREKALGELYDMSISLDDALAAGDTLEDAAKHLGLQAQKTQADAGGRKGDGTPATDVPAFSQFLPTAFRTELNRESRVIDAAEGGYFVVRVDRITPPSALPIEAVKDRVKSDWLRDEKTTRTLAIAQKIRDTAKDAAMDAAAFAKLAADSGLELKTSPAFTRSGAGLSGAFGAPMVSQVFSLKIGEYALSPAGGGNVDIARLKEIVAVDPATAQAQMNALKDQLAAALTDDMANAYQRALQTKYGVLMNQAAYDTAMTMATQNLPAARKQ